MKKMFIIILSVSAILVLTFVFISFQNKTDNIIKSQVQLGTILSDTNGTIVCSEKLLPNNPSSKTSTIIAFSEGGTKSHVLISEGFNYMPITHHDGSGFLYVNYENKNFIVREYTFVNKSIRDIATFTTPIIKPSMAPDKKTIIFSKENEIYLMNGEGGNIRKITTTTKGTTFYNPDTGNPQLGPDGKPQYFAGSISSHISPTGKEFVYSSTQDGDFQVWKKSLIDPNSVAIQLTNSLAKDTPHANVPFFSYDGTKIVMWAGYEGNYGEIWIMNSDGSNPQKITETLNPRNSDDPWFAPDGNYIVYISNRDDKGVSAYIHNIEKNTDSLLANDISFCTWAPQSRK